MLMPAAHRNDDGRTYVADGLSSHEAEGTVFSKITAFRRYGCWRRLARLRYDAGNGAREGNKAGQQALMSNIHGPT